MVNSILIAILFLNDTLFKLNVEYFFSFCFHTHIPCLTQPSYLTSAGNNMFVLIIVSGFNNLAKVCVLLHVTTFPANHCQWLQ